MKLLILIFLTSSQIAIDTIVREVELVDISDNGLNLIKQFEGFSSIPYKDSGGIWTIGFGTILYPDGKTVTGSDPPITKEQALEFLKHNVNQKCDSINKMVTAVINQNQFDSLCSFAYNLGVNALRNSTLLKLVNQGKFQEAAQEFSRWTKDDGRVIPGLERRRTAEYNLFTGVTDVASN